MTREGGRAPGPRLDGRAVAVRDAGFTEIAPGSVTVIAEVITGADDALGDREVADE